MRCLVFGSTEYQGGVLDFVERRMGQIDDEDMNGSFMRMCATM